jgi:Tfp pilus assembly protein PilV
MMMNAIQPTQSTRSLPARLARQVRRGLTFIEVEMALLLLLLGVLSVIELSPLTLQGTRLSEQHIMASQAARYILDSYLDQSYSSHVLAMNNWLGGGTQLPQIDTGNLTNTSGGPATDIVIAGITPKLYTYRVQRYTHPTMPGPSGTPAAVPAAAPGTGGIVVLVVEVWWKDPTLQRYNRSTADRVVRLVGYKTDALNQ